MWLLVQVMQLAVEIAAYGKVFAAVSLSNLSAAAEVMLPKSFGQARNATQCLTCSNVEPVMKPNAYSPLRGCRMRTHSRKDCVVSFAGFTAALTCLAAE